MTLSKEYRRQFQWRDWKTALDLCPLLPGQSVLDLGCGTGEIAKELFKKGAIVTGVDQNPELLENAKKTCPDASFLLGDLNSLQIKPESSCYGF